MIDPHSVVIEIDTSSQLGREEGLHSIKRNAWKMVISVSGNKGHLLP